MDIPPVETIAAMTWEQAKELEQKLLAKIQAIFSEAQHIRGRRNIETFIVAMKGLRAKQFRSEFRVIAGGRETL
jgi:hypothetical protein